MAGGANSLNQFIRFGTDAYGIERLLRLFQALTQLLLAYPSLALILLPLPSSLLSPSPSPSTPKPLDPVILSAIRNRLATLRRPFRFFRFLDSFTAAWAAWQTPLSSTSAAAVSSPRPGWLPEQLERYLDAAAKSFTGMYYLLESATFPEALDIPGLSVWGEERARLLAVEAQRFWFLGLVCAVLAGGLRALFLSWALSLSLAPAAAGERRAEGSGEGEAKGNVPATRGESGGDVHVVVGLREKRRITARRMVADALDLAVPGSVIGWVPFSSGVVSLLMFWSTILTGLEVWERCGREVAAEKAAGEEFGGKLR
ncbi:hypothetical protein N656DRAFT_772218 [Canariomyces notabilis]|uniref:Uncharacterized protein n=1 Tax=Canariomyces notabilis TaxID=2074819 RepID=A0AAN6QGV8_9PEZI|nr:hypothetical protein N656DRAFT_772218 [Canariomyces arenarius]